MTGQQKAIENTESSFVERLAREIGITANAKHIYGDPVERDGVTVIPVAKAVYGFGGGGGNKAGEKGSGGGGGVILTPIGYIEIKQGETRFRPTSDRLALVPAILATAAPVILLAVWAFNKQWRNNVKK